MHLDIVYQRNRQKRLAKQFNGSSSWPLTNSSGLKSLSLWHNEPFLWHNEVISTVLRRIKHACPHTKTAKLIIFQTDNCNTSLIISLALINYHYQYLLPKTITITLSWKYQQHIQFSLAAHQWQPLHPLPLQLPAYGLVIPPTLIAIFVTLRRERRWIIVSQRMTFQAHHPSLIVQINQLMLILKELTCTQADVD